MGRGVNRRSLVIGAMVALPAAAGAGRAIAAPDAPSGVQALIDAHRAACALYDETTAAESAAEAAYLKTRPENWLPLPFGRGQVEYLSDSGMGPLNATSCAFATIRNCFSTLFLHGIDTALLEPINAVTDAEKTRIDAELGEAQAREEAFRRQCGYADVRDRAQAASEAEYDALTALINAAPADLAEARAKAVYLVTLLETVGVEREREMFLGLAI
ncbi:hypothetical protein EN850_20870 [Mesorhizobium sp. M8A.F.Ca.ET.207.01.1.1]|uniref:hypothetical protein n=1 Tax=Mesorhizobium sp. M8A.F.Ca.ET.207.01.1.1 TaxID=2563968 RepID=UPI00113CEEE2|nr:hypothetical protein [Mesorhizobium sp. M8A.F.Ca.ET.207.01.1.1]TGQ79344.1 hypothetical protein EN850_20870 [Mesorhizobium sp. M8A.F.Ca.ET.207.01.1.1]